MPSKKPKKVIDIRFPGNYKEEKKIEKKSSSAWKWLVLILIIIVLFFASSHFLFAELQATVSLIPEDLSFEKEIIVDISEKSLDLSSLEKKMVLPGRILEKEKTLANQFEASGMVFKEGKAKGVIRIFNDYHLSQILVATTRFQPPLDKVIYFRTTKRVVIEPKDYLDVEVVADKPGSEYNINPITFSVPGLLGLPQYYSVYGKSFSEMKGGSKEKVPEVSSEDLEKATETLTEQLKAQTGKEILQIIPDNFVLSTKAIKEEIIDVSSSVPVGAPENNFNLEIKAKVKGFVFNKSDLEKLLLSFCDDKTSKKVKQDTLSFNYNFQDIDFEQGNMVLEVKFSAKVFEDIGEKELERALIGRTIKEGRILLENYPGIKEFQFKIYPFWLKTIPQTVKIKMIY